MQTVATLKDMKERGEKITMLTCYDYTFAKIFGDSGIDTILVGDSMGNTMLGYENTLPVTLEDIIWATRAVRRGAPDTFIIADMPFMSYHISIKDTVVAAGRLAKKAGAHAVKLEGGAEFADEIKAIVRAQIPVVGHLGLTPQSVNVFGGFKVQAKTADAVKALISDAKAVEDAGAFMLVLEGIPIEVAELVMQAVHIPVIGIGAGNGVDGQVLVMQDMLGLNGDNVPKFVRTFGDLGSATKAATQKYMANVKSSAFPSDEYSFHFPKGAISELEKVKTNSNATHNNSY